jgi:hypothetical protein
MAAVLYEPAFAVIATWFRQGRGRALALLMCSGLASVIFVPLTLVEQAGWRAALLVLSVLLAGGTLPLHAFLLRRHPRDRGLLPDGTVMPPDPTAPSRSGEASVSTRDAVRATAFWWLTGAFALRTFAAVAAVIHLIPYLLEQGYSVGFAATATALMAWPGRRLFRPRGSRLPRRWVTASLVPAPGGGAGGAAGGTGTGRGAGERGVLFGARSGALTPAWAALGAAPYGPADDGRSTGARAPIFGLLLLVSLLAAGAVLQVHHTTR